MESYITFILERKIVCWLCNEYPVYFTQTAHLWTCVWRCISVSWLDWSGASIYSHIYYVGAAVTRPPGARGATGPQRALLLTVNLSDPLSASHVFQRLPLTPPSLNSPCVPSTHSHSVSDGAPDPLWGQLNPPEGPTTLLLSENELWALLCLFTLKEPGGTFTFTC